MHASAAVAQGRRRAPQRSRLSDPLRSGRRSRNMAEPKPDLDHIVIDVRAELQPFPIGLNGLVFKTSDAERIHREAHAAGLPVLPVQSLSRPVTLAEETRDARFRTTRLDPKAVAMGRVY